MDQQKLVVEAAYLGTVQHTVVQLKIHMHTLKNWLTRKDPWCWERLKAGGEGDDRAWDGWMASLTRWTWVWISSRSWWWTGKPGVLQSMWSLRVRHDWTTSLSLFHFHALEKEMATHYSVLAWRTPGTGEPGGLPSMGSHRVGHDWSDLTAAAAGWS